MKNVFSRIDLSSTSIGNMPKQLPSCYINPSEELKTWQTQRNFETDICVMH